MANNTRLKPITDADIPVSASARRELIKGAMEVSASQWNKELAMECLTRYPDESNVMITDNLIPVAYRMAEGNEVAFLAILLDTKKQWAEIAGVPYGSKQIPAIERILIDRIVTCHLALVMAENAVTGTHTLAKMDCLQRTLDRAHKRYLSAIKALAEVRRLALPVLPAVNVAMSGATQVNIGEKQINAQMTSATMN